MSTVEKLVLSETVHLDRSQIEALVLQLGPKQADQEVNQALEDLAVTLASVQRASTRGQTDALREGLRGLIAIAHKTGMTSLARVSRDVLELSDSSDTPGFCATLARLGRIGERSLIAVWDLQDMSI